MKLLRRKDKAVSPRKPKKKYKSSYGAVTVFLTMILLPCMIFVCAYGDVARVRLSQSQAVSSSDLALYSLLSHYDEDLKEWYGLVSSVDNIDTFYDVTADYFTGMMSAAGLDENASELFTAYISALRAGDVSDFLQVEEVASTTVSPVANASMGSNAALIEDGIVEFMKYRGPISLAERIYNRFTSTGAASQLVDASKDQPIQEAKQEFAEAEGEMLEELLYTYLATINYVDYRTAHGVPDIQMYQNQYAEHLSHIRDDLAKVTDLITKYYSYSSSIADISSNFLSYTMPSFNTPDSVRNPRNGLMYDFDSIHAEEIDEENETYYIGASDIYDITKNVSTYINNISNAAQEVVTAYNNAGLTKPTSSNDLNPVVYCMKVQNLGIQNKVSTINTNADNLMVVYAKLLLANECEVPEKTSPSDTDWAKEIDDAISSIEACWRNYLTYSNKTTTYETILADYRDVAVTQGTVDYTKNYKYEFSSEYCGGYYKTIGGFFEAVRDEFGTLSSQLDEQIKQVDLIINGGTVTYNGKEYKDKVVSLTELKTAIRNYTDKRDDWGTEAHSQNTTYAQQEQKEYDRIDDTQKLAAALSENGDAAVEEFRTRLTNIRKDMQDLKDALDSFTYGGTAVYTLTRATAVSSAQTKVPTDLNSVSPKLSENASAAANYNSQLVSPASGTLYTPPTLKTGTTGNNPDLHTDPPELYKYMVEAMPRGKVDDAVNKKDEVEKENDEAKEAANKEAEASKGYDSTYLNDAGSSLPETTSGNGFGISTVIKSLVKTIETLVSGNFGELRDQIYVAEYCMDMFSYSTFNNEGRYHLASKEGKNLTFSQYPSSFNSYNDTWNKDDPTELNQIYWPYNQSLTNRQINSSNNKANLGEIEYLLFGEKDFKKNLEDMYTDLFLIREALNLVAGFQVFYNPSNNATSAAINGIAVGIQAATLGIVPVPLTTCIIIAVMATCETALDVKRLKSGVPVALYKGEEEEWIISFNGGISSIVGSAAGKVGPEDTNGLFYSDYLYLFLIMMVSDSDSYKSLLLRVGDLIEANMTLGKGEDFDLESSYVYFNLSSSLHVKPLFMTLPVDNWLDGVDSSPMTDSTDWCTYKVNVIRGYS